MSKQHVMLDLETMGTSHDAAIVAIGAVEFDKDGIKSEFYETIDLNDSAKYGEIGASTVLWWMSQNDGARSEITSADKTLYNALMMFDQWLPKNACVWGNGSDFDNVILANAYDALGMHQPWLLKNNRCFRTVKNMQPKLKLERIGTYHNALDDASYQCTYLRMLEVITYE